MHTAPSHISFPPRCLTAKLSPSQFGDQYQPKQTSYTAKCWLNVGLARRPWLNIEPALVQCKLSHFLIEEHVICVKYELETYTVRWPHVQIQAAVTFDLSIYALLLFVFAWLQSSLPERWLSLLITSSADYNALTLIPDVLLLPTQSQDEWSRIYCRARTNGSNCLLEKRQLLLFASVLQNMHPLSIPATFSNAVQLLVSELAFTSYYLR